MKKTVSTNSRMIFILATMFLNFLGFSIIFPILPFMVEKYVSDPHQVAVYVGLLLSAYAFCQFVSAPGLGALSDRHGRRLILLLSLLGSVIGYLIMGIGGAIWVLFLGRIIDGLTGGNISTIYAYMADITEPRDRGKYFGLLGVAAGFGMVFGPAIGGFLALIHLSAPLFIAAGITFLDILLGYFILPESLSEEHRSEKVLLNHLNPLKQFRVIFSSKALKLLFLSTFFYFIALNAMYANNSVFAKDVFYWNPTQIGIMLFVVGLVDIFSQGVVLRKLLPKLGENKVATLGLIITALGFIVAAITAEFPSVIVFYIAVILFNFGGGLFEPSQGGLISTTAGPKIQGRVQGANQGMQSIARIIGPFFVAWIYQFWRGLPYATEAFFVIIALIVLVIALPKVKDQKKIEVETF